MKGSIGYSGKSGSSLGMYGAGKGYGSMGGSPKLKGGYGLGKCLNGMKGYGRNQSKSGMVYAVIGMGYIGSPEELAQGMQQYMSMLSQYVTGLLSGYGGKSREYSGLMPAKDAYKSLGNKAEDKPCKCEICSAPTFKGMRRCLVCSVVVDKY